MSNRIILLNQAHVGEQNPRGNPVIGWKPANGAEGLVNPAGWASLRIIHQDDQGNPLYDQSLIVESPGSIVVCNDEDGKVGLVQVFRPNGPRPEGAGSDYVAKLDKEQGWDTLIRSLGCFSWEAPRGMVPNLDGSNLQELILKTAQIEAAEEAGFQLKDLRIVGQINPNTTWFAHSQYVVQARIARIGKSSPEPMEQFGKTRLFSPAEVRELAMEGKLVCGLTLAALALCGLHF